MAPRGADAVRPGFSRCVGGCVDVERTDSHIRKGASAQITREALNWESSLAVPHSLHPLPKPLLEAAILGFFEVFYLKAEGRDFKFLTGSSCYA